MRNYLVDLENGRASFTVRFEAKNLSEARRLVDGIVFMLDAIIVTEVGINP